ncbi:MAG: prephenate dehydrogenase [Methanosarcinales archaeon]|nr:prephenate dehydrogenase [Methanosarcinales archaeon]
MNILIIGGTGDTGQWFTKFYKKHGWDVTVWGANARHDIAESLGVPFADDLDTEIARSDVVMISVPIDLTEQVIVDIAPKMKAGSLLMDITSVKTVPVNAMLQYAPEGVEVLGTHPMFGPTIPDLQGQIVILVPVEGRSEHWLPVIRSLYEGQGAHIEVTSAREHDRMMAIVQGLTHFAYISIGGAMAELDFDVARSRRFMSPVYEIMVDFVGRILAQNPYLYAMIQMNPEVEAVHEAYMKVCREMSDQIKRGDVQDFVDTMKHAAVHFGDTQAALGRSDKLINAKISEFQELIHSIGSEQGLRHQYSGVTHVGTIRKVTPLTVTIERSGREIELKIENTRLLHHDELVEWKKQNLTHNFRDVSAIIPHGASPDIIRELVSQLDGMVSVEIIDIYDGLENDSISVTFRVIILGDLDAGKVHSKVNDLLSGVGCKVR